METASQSPSSDANTPTWITQQGMVMTSVHDEADPTHNPGGEGPVGDEQKHLHHKEDKLGDEEEAYITPHSGA